MPECFCFGFNCSCFVCVQITETVKQIPTHGSVFLYYSKKNILSPRTGPGNPSCKSPQCTTHVRAPPSQKIWCYYAVYVKLL
mmetsp:Transcript_81454/g.143660  ORF Transcript_81454/g.143660 Transcript_81454/m.143660 type:complete len:82 (-) Transcript_81454:2570-2815(-)